MLPSYLAKALPNPPQNRAPWYINIAPSYAGVFLWIAFYNDIAKGTIAHASLAACMVAVAVAGLLCYALYYRAPAMLGMQTGYSLYVVGSSTFGTKGGYLMPGLLMGALQVGWYAVGTFFSTRFILNGFGSDAGPGSLPFVLVAMVWGYSMAYVGVMGVRYVAKLAIYLNLIPFLMILLVFWRTKEGIPQHHVAEPDTWFAMMMLMQIIIGFFSTAGAAGTDFGMSVRDGRDVRLGGLTGISLAIVYSAGLPLLAIAGARAMYGSALPGLGFDNVIGALGGFLATAMFFLFAIASIPPACFCAFITGNSFSTMIPAVSRLASTMAGVTVAIALAGSGVAQNLVGFFTIVGASFGPICGAMTADYLLAGRRWSGPRQGINWAGYIAWAIGFLVGILPFLPFSPEVRRLAQPAVVYSYAAGFLVYAILAKAGLQPQVVDYPVQAEKARV